MSWLHMQLESARPSPELLTPPAHGGLSHSLLLPHSSKQRQHTNPSTFWKTPLLPDPQHSTMVALGHLGAPCLSYTSPFTKILLLLRIQCSAPTFLRKRGSSGPRPSGCILTQLSHASPSVLATTWHRLHWSPMETHLHNPDGNS